MVDPSMMKRRKTGLPRVLRAFSHINRYWDPHQEVYAAKILPGQYYVTLHEEMIVTVLGSCVSACIRDSQCGIGGMNHFMLPNSGESRGLGAHIQSTDDAARYGVHAMELLINEILKNGGQRKNLEVKITGGGRMIANISDIGQQNIDFVREFVNTEGLFIAAEDVGDIYPRKVYYYPATGKVRVKKLRTMHNETIANRETEYLMDLNDKSIRGDIELF